MRVLKAQAFPNDRSVSMPKRECAAALTAGQQDQRVLVGQRVAGIAELKSRSAELRINVMRPDRTPRLLVERVNFAGATGGHYPVPHDLRHGIRPRPYRFGVAVGELGFIGVLPNGGAGARVKRDADIL